MIVGLVLAAVLPQPLPLVAAVAVAAACAGGFGTDPSKKNDSHSGNLPNQDSKPNSHLLLGVFLGPFLGHFLGHSLGLGLMRLGLGVLLGVLLAVRIGPAWFLYQVRLVSNC